MSVQTKQLRRKISKASGDNILKQQTIGDSESKQEDVNQCMQEVIIKIQILKQILRIDNSNKNDENAAELEGSITEKSENTELERKIKQQNKLTVV